MLIKDLTFLTDSQPFDLGGGEQKRVNLVLVKFPQSQQPEEIRPGYFIINTCKTIFSMQHTRSGQYKKVYDCLAVRRGKTLQREMICYYEKRKPPKNVEIIFDKAVYGTVRNPIANIAVFNVNILLYPFQCPKPLVSTISNAFGDYLIEGIPACTYRITASKWDYYTFQAKITITDSQQFWAINIPLIPKSYANCKTKT